MDANASAPRGPVTPQTASSPVGSPAGSHAGPRPPAAPDLAPLVALVSAWDSLAPFERVAVRDAVFEVSVALDGVTKLHAMLRGEGRLP